MKKAAIAFDWELLKDILHLPRETLLVGAEYDPNYGAGTVKFIVSHPDLPEVREGDAVITTYARYSRQPAQPAVVKFEGWGWRETAHSPEQASGETSAATAGEPSSGLVG